MDRFGDFQKLLEGGKFVYNFYPFFFAMKLCVILKEEEKLFFFQTKKIFLVSFYLRNFIKNLFD